MNSLSHGFLFLVGLSWLLGETCLSASNGNWTPLWLYLAGFTVMFSIMGCLPLSTKTINKAGPIFTIIMGLAIVGYSLGPLSAKMVGGFLLRVIGGGALVVLGVLSFLSAKDEKEAHH
ncbi:MAG: hypothetical protein CMO55_00530 [Verrucomicrobiales bacterium]|nr:hypothetical protein [Verrucomicrobiales bacterium]